MMETATVGVIGGSGLYAMADLTDVTTVTVTTPFGSPSAPIVIGTLRGKRTAFLPRHGIGHVYSPSTVPYRANIYALKSLGVRHILSVSACGSLREHLQPGEMVIPDQLLDMTKHDRGNTFFSTGLVAHVSVADPFCPDLRSLLINAAQRIGAAHHGSGTFVTIEGPRFSTRAESAVYRQLGCDIIGMTACPEAFLAREAEISYASLAHVTDYDVWHTSESPVTVDQVVAISHRNLATAQQIVAETLEALPESAVCSCHTAMDHALMTAFPARDTQVVGDLKPIVGRVLGPAER